MLSRFEQRQLRAIERSLETDDPMFAERIRSTAAASTTDQGRSFFTVLAIVGAGLAVLGLVVSPSLVVFGGFVAAIALWLRLVRAWVDRGDHEQANPGRDGA